jgi:hypothetical protein
MHLYHDAGSRLKILEQAHCAHCWRPLRTNSAWPGPRESHRPPYGNGRHLLVANCGHVFHGACAVKPSHCPKCFVFIAELIPLNYCKLPDPTQSTSRSTLDPTSPETRNDPVPSSPSRSSPVEEEPNLKEAFKSLNQILDAILNEIVTMRRHLQERTKYEKPDKTASPRRWRWFERTNVHLKIESTNTYIEKFRIW